jgi:hypothetical protein
VWNEVWGKRGYIASPGFGTDIKYCVTLKKLLMMLITSWGDPYLPFKAEYKF